MRKISPITLKSNSFTNKQSLKYRAAAQWIGTNGINTITPSAPKSDKEADALTKIYQNKIRQSPILDQFRKVYGPQNADEALKLCRVIFKSKFG